MFCYSVANFSIRNYVTKINIQNSIDDGTYERAPSKKLKSRMLCSKQLNSLATHRSLDPKSSLLSESGRCNEIAKNRTISIKNSLFENTQSLPFKSIFQEASITHTRTASLLLDQENDLTRMDDLLMMTDENETSDTNPLRIDLETNSVIHYSINSSFKFRNLQLSSGDQRLLLPTTIVSENNDELNLKLLNIWLALLITDFSFLDESVSSIDLNYRIEANRIDQKGKLRLLQKKARDITKMIVYVDQIIQTMIKFTGNQNFNIQCAQEQNNREDLTTFKDRVTLILKVLILENVPKVDEHPFSELLQESLKSAEHLKQLTGYWKHTKNRGNHNDNPVLKIFEELRYIPLTLLDSLSFEIIIPKTGVEVNSYKEEIAALELFTLVYVILLLEMKKLFEVTIAISGATKINTFLDHQLILDCFEAFLYSSVISGNVEIIVGLDKLVKEWVRDDVLLREQTKSWGTKIISNWNCKRTEEDIAHNLQYTDADYNIARASTINEFDIVKLFISEILDICDDGGANGPISATLIQANTRSHNEFGWLTIFQNDADNRISSIETCEIETIFGSDRDSTERCTVRITANENDTRIKKLKQSHSKRRRLRHWFSLHSNDFGKRHSFLEKCHRAKSKIASLIARLSFRNNSHTCNSWKPKIIDEHTQQKVSVHYACPKSHCTINSHKSLSCDGMKDIIGRNLETKQEELINQDKGGRFEEIYERTTFSDLIESCNRYEELKRKKDRFMFLFFGEEK